MVPTPSTEPAVYSAEERKLLLGLAHDSIGHGLEHASPQAVALDVYPQKLCEQRASFVTLQRNGRLRGCIGHLQAIQALVLDVAENAYAAAFRDPRFPALDRREYDGISLKISVLSAPQPLPFRDRDDLLGKIRPGIDGLILSAPSGQRGTFLPSVWESLPQAGQFLDQLVVKAGLPAGYWCDNLSMEYYTTESFS